MGERPEENREIVVRALTDHRSGTVSAYSAAGLRTHWRTDARASLEGDCQVALCAARDDLAIEPERVPPGRPLLQPGRFGRSVVQPA
jgi:hypothetical protein